MSRKTKNNKKQWLIDLPTGRRRAMQWVYYGVCILYMGYSVIYFTLALYWPWLVDSPLLSVVLMFSSCLFAFMIGSFTPWLTKTRRIHPRPPKRWLNRAWYIVFMPAMISGVLIVVFLGIALTDPGDMGQTLGAATASGIIMVALIWIGSVNYRKLDDALHRTLAARQVCFHCGYNLAGNPEGPTCPECGQPVMQPGTNPAAGLQ